MAAGSPIFDPRIALVLYAPGVVMTRDIEAAVMAQYAANGNQPLSQAQTLVIVGALPTLPKGLKRFADSNPCPRDNWSIDNQAVR